jgi:hypothetical protein
VPKKRVGRRPVKSSQDGRDYGEAMLANALEAAEADHFRSCSEPDRESTGCRTLLSWTKAQNPVACSQLLVVFSRSFRP